MHRPQRPEGDVDVDVTSGPEVGRTACTAVQIVAGSVGNLSEKACQLRGLVIVPAIPGWPLSPVVKALDSLRVKLLRLFFRRHLWAGALGPLASEVRFESLRVEFAVVTGKLLSGCDTSTRKAHAFLAAGVGCAFQVRASRVIHEAGVVAAEHVAA